MFVITNRDVEDSQRGFAKFGDVPNRKGPNELRIVEATKSGNRWRIDVLPDLCTDKMKSDAGIGDQGDVFCSEYVSRKIRAAVQENKRHVLLYVHGFNNDMKDVLEQTDRLRQLYRMEVVAKYWH